MLRPRSALVAAPLVLAGLVLGASPAAMARTEAPRAGHSRGVALAAPSTPVQPRLALAAAPAIINDNATFYGDSCASTSSCVAVGFYQIPSEDIAPALVENYTSGSWQADVPIPQYSAYATLAEEVSCGAAGACMLVGEHYNKPAKPSMLAEISSGPSWSMLQWNNPAGARWGVLDAVSCVGSSYCMAVGTEDRRAQQVYSAQWHGSGVLKQVSTPNPAHARWAELAGVSCLSATDCVAVGNYESAAKRVLTFSLMWNGTKWQILTGTPNLKHQTGSYFNDIACASATQCMAVGYSLGSGKHPAVHGFAATWLTGKWRLSATPNRLGAGLVSVSCPTVSYCMAVGIDGRYADAERWNGASWRFLSVPRTRAPRSDDGLEHVSCVSTSHCVAVGYRYIPKHNYTDNTLAEVWNGSSWKVQGTANP